MVEVTIDSIRVSLMSNHRLVILKDGRRDRYLTIWVGPCEADAITVTLQEQEIPRPLTHDLLRNTITEMGGIPEYVLIHSLQNDVFHAKIVIKQAGRQISLDSRSSDAIAFAVRVKVPIYVEEAVLEIAATEPDQEVQTDVPNIATQSGAAAEATDERLNIFQDYIDQLDLDNLGDEDQ